MIFRVPYSILKAPGDYDHMGAPLKIKILKIFFFFFLLAREELEIDLVPNFDDPRSSNGRYLHGQMMKKKKRDFQNFDF